MSSVYQPKRKELAKVSVVSSEKYSQNRKNIKLVGCIQRSCTKEDKGYRQKVFQKTASLYIEYTIKIKSTRL